MVYAYIKSVLDSEGYANSQDTPLAEITSTESELFVYTGGDTEANFQIGCTRIDNVQEFTIYGVTKDLYYENSVDNAMGRKLLGIFNTLRKGLPYSATDTNGTHYITDCVSPAIKFVGTDNKTLRITELKFNVLWSYNYGNIS